MHGPFEDKVVPLTLFVLGVMDRIRESDGALPEQDEIRPRLKNMLGQFNVRGAQEEDFSLAKSAMVYWIDELLVNSDWTYASQWRDNPLEREIYGSRNRAWKFFENADYARSLESTDALEVFGQCVALGFQGIYRSESLRRAVFQDTAQRNADDPPEEAEINAQSESADSVAEQLNGEPLSNGVTAVLEPTAKPVLKKQTNGHMPQTLSEWAAPVFSQLCGEGGDSYKPASAPETPRDARPLTGNQHFFRWSMVLAATIVLSLLILAVRG